MLKYLKAALLTATIAAVAAPAFAGDPEEGAKVFRKCAACHSIGEGAKSRVGPHSDVVPGQANPEWAVAFGLSLNSVE